MTRATSTRVLNRPVGSGALPRKRLGSQNYPTMVLNRLVGSGFWFWPSSEFSLSFLVSMKPVLSFGPEKYIYKMIYQF